MDKIREAERNDPMFDALLPRVDWNAVNWNAVTGSAAVVSIIVSVVLAVWAVRFSMTVTNRQNRDRDTAWVKNFLVLVAKAWNSAGQNVADLSSKNVDEFRLRAAEMSRSGERGWIVASLDRLRSEPPPSTAIFALVHQSYHAITTFDRTLSSGRVMGAEDTLPKLRILHEELEACCVAIGREALRLGARALQHDDISLAEWLPTRTGRSRLFFSRLLAALPGPAGSPYAKAGGHAGSTK